VALAAVPDHRHVLALDQGQVGVVVVVDLSHEGLSFCFIWCGAVVTGTPYSACSVTITPLYMGFFGGC
jgi:hypothetical protein